MSVRTNCALLSAVAAVSMFACGVASATVYSTPYTPAIAEVPGELQLFESYTGTLDATSLVWRRAAQSANGSETAPNAPTALGTAGNYPYAVHTFVAPATATYRFYSAQAHDGYLHLYQNSFDPNNQLVNVLAGDDDMGTLNSGAVPNRNGVATTNDSGFIFTLTGGTTYQLVQSTFSAAVPAAGQYYNETYRTIGGSPAVPATPIYTVADGGATPSSNSPGAPTTITLNVPSTAGNITAFNSASIINAATTFVGDVTVTLTHNGVSVDLLDRVGRTTATSFGSGGDLLANGSISFADGGEAVPTAGANLLNGTTYAPFTNGLEGIESSPSNGALSSFVGMSAAGEWILTVTDWGAGDIMTISAFSLDLTTGGAAIAGDYNRDGYVDAADYTVWADSFGQAGSGLAADGNGDSVVDAADYTIWADNFGQGTPPGSLSSSVPEPTALAFAAPALALLARRRR